MHLNIDGKSLTASKSALNDYKTAIEQLPDSEALKHDCLERAQQCRKDAEAEVAEHQQELARQQEVFAEMEREIPQVQTSIGNCNEEIQHLRNRLSDAEDDDQRSSLYEQIHAAENRRRNLEEELERCEEKKKVAQERMDAETILIKKYQEKCEELTTLYQNLESSLSQYSENMVQYRSTVTAKATDMMGALDQISSIQQSYENFSLSGGDIGSGAGGFSSGAAMLGSGGGSAFVGSISSAGVVGGTKQTSSSINSVKSSIPKRTYQETEHVIKEKLPNSYHDGNIDKLFNRNGTIEFVKSTPKGTQKPDQYRFSGNTMYIKEEKNYKIENGTSSVVQSISNQLIKRIDCFFGATVPASVSGEEKDSKIEKMDLEYIIDLHGHYYHKDGSPVSISELNSIPERIYEKVKNHFEQTHTGKRFDDYITIQNNNLFSFGTNRILTGI